jgi:sortase B
MTNMDTEKIRAGGMYKIAGVQKTNQGGAAAKKRAKIPTRRFMAEIGARFRDKTDAGETGSIFYDSLAGMTQGDIVLNEAAQNSKKPQADILRYFMLFLSLAIFACTAYMIYDRILGYISAAREYDALHSIFYDDEELPLESQILTKTKINVPIQDILSVMQRHTTDRDVEAESSDGVGEVDRKRVNIKKIADINSDLYCWIKVTHTGQTGIDYPVVQTTDNDWYLYHSFEGKVNPSGAIYIDYRNSRDVMQNRNTVIYGHNMLDGSMFQPLLDFGRYPEYFKNGIIELITEDAMYYFEIFSAREEDPSSGYIDTYFETDEEWIEFLYKMQERSNFKKDFQFDADSRIVTLSTCVNETWRNWRFVVQGILIDVK